MMNEEMKLKVMPGRIELLSLSFRKLRYYLCGGMECRMDVGGAWVIGPEF
jgi:hypothetical protein